MKKLTVSVLGSEWTVMVAKESEEPRLSYIGGFTDQSCREIVIADRHEEATIRNFMDEIMHTLRHELVHAFMFESGLGEDWKHETGHDETIVDWIACQMPKIMNAYNKVATKLANMVYEEWNKE